MGTMGGERNHSLSLAVASTAVATSYPSFRLDVIVDTIDTGGKHTVSLASVYLERTPPIPPKHDSYNRTYISFFAALPFRISFSRSPFTISSAEIPPELSSSR